MKFIKNHKLLMGFIILLLICIALGIFLLYQLIGGNKKGEYGDRLKGIEKVEITDKQETNIEKEISKEESVEKVKYDLRGRLVNIIVDVKDEIELDKVKEIGTKILEHFDEEQLSYYDIQIFINSDNKKSEKYPIIGYKHKTKDAISWN